MASMFDFAGTLVVLAWAMHEVVHWHELAREDEREPAFARAPAARSAAPERAASG